MPYTLEDVFGIGGDQLAMTNGRSAEAPTYSAQAGPSPVGSPGTYAAFTDWKHSPVFWLAAFAIVALGIIHLEGNVSAALRV